MDALPIADDPPARTPQVWLGFAIVSLLLLSAVVVAALVAPR